VITFIGSFSRCDCDLQRPVALVQHSLKACLIQRVGFALTGKRSRLRMCHPQTGPSFLQKILHYQPLALKLPTRAGMRSFVTTPHYSVTGSLKGSN
jgi:hypothetical protein